jgi:hypothetical protein
VKRLGECDKRDSFPVAMTAFSPVPNSVPDTINVEIFKPKTQNRMHNSSPSESSNRRYLYSGGTFFEYQQGY